MKRKLTEEEIQKALSKEWKDGKRKIIKIKVEDYEKNPKIVERNINLCKVTHGPKTLEGKRRILENLNCGGYPKQVIKHGGYVKRILNEDESDFYNQRKDLYLQEFDLNNSSDEVLLNMVLIEEVIIYRLLKILNDKPSAHKSISRPLTEAQARLHKNLDGLAMLRKQRINQDRMDKQMSIVRLASDVMKNKEKIEKQMQEELEEELEFLKNKRERDMQIIDVECEEKESDEKE